MTIKHTPGPVTVYSPGYSGARVEVMAAPRKERQFSIALMADGDDATVKANAELIAEAFNVATETGMTPRQLQSLHGSGLPHAAKLMEDRAELLVVLKGIACGLYGHQTEYLETARAAIAKAEQAKP